MTLVDKLFRQDEWRTVPNAISAARLLLLPVFLVLIVDQHYWSAMVVIAVVFVTGPAGIGKSTLLDALAGVERVVRVDGRDVEPTPPAFLAALDRALDDAARRWAGGAPVRFVADTSVIARWSDAKD